MKKEGTVRALSKILVKLGIATGTFGVRDVQAGYTLPVKKEYNFAEETYGDESMVYLHFKNKLIATKIAKILRLAGFPTEYQPLKYTKPKTTIHRLEIQVAYFRGNNWDE